MSTFLLNKKYLPHRVGVCFIIGIIAGLFFHDFSIWVKPAGDLFMNMIKMLIVPVIFFSVTSGIAAIGDVQRLKRIGSKVVIVYFLMTVIACIVGIVMVNITHPGVGFTLDNMQAFDTSKVKTPSFVNFLFDMVPVNIVDSMAKNQIMQMIFFTVLVGVARAFAVLAKKAGVYGMVGGQVVDVESEKSDDCSITREKLDFIYRLKTGALIESSMMIGAILAGASSDEVSRVEQIAAKLGLAFQIQDDVLDVTSTLEVLGKPVGSDEKNNKATYVTFEGLDKAVSDVERISKEAEEQLDDLGYDDAFLKELFEYLIHREK